VTTTTTDTSTAGRPAAGGLGARLRSVPLVLWRGRTTDAAWVRPAFLGLLAIAALLYMWNLAANGWANAFYSAAVQAGATNWEAFLYGSSDAGNSITVDKPPASLWVMALSVRIFGLSSFSILLPEAIMGVLTVALVYAIVRRHLSPQAGLIAGAVTALTPVAVLMFRFNNPDALLVLLVTLATYLTMRGIEDGRVRWGLWAGVAVGLGFLTKQLQAFLILPVLVGVYLYASPRRIGIRFAHLFGALGTLIVSAGWWVAIVTLVPASMRPYIGGSQSNSFLELTFGYNGFGRLTGNETGSVTGGGGGTTTTTTGGGMWGSTGIGRMFSGEFGTQIAWLLPAALALLVVGVVVLWRRPRVDGARAVVLLLGGTLVVTGVAFSFGAGIIHPYYSVSLAPAIGGLVGASGWLLWERRAALWVRIVAAVVVLGTTWWSVVLMSEASDFLPWLRVVVVTAGVLAAVALIALPWVRAFGPIAAAAALVAALAAPLAWSVNTTLTAHTGSLPTAGPAVASAGFGGGRGGGAGFGGTRPNFGQGGGFGNQGTAQGTPPQGGPGTQQGGTTQGGFGGLARGGGGGGLLGGNTTVSSALTEALQSNASSYTWAAAAVGSQNAASYQLASGAAVMPLGGFNGSDPSPTLAQFEQYVSEGRIHYFIGGSGIGQSNGGSSNASSIAAWVEANFSSSTVGGVTVYDLTSGSATAGA
jgi:4-amino-4-deoxy-L-arabinose transferase-like glycosyltransferase